MNRHTTDAFSNKAEAFEAFDDIPTHDVKGPTIGDIIQTRFGRRGVLKGALAVTTISFLMGPSAVSRSAMAATTSSAFDFNELQAGVDQVWRSIGCRGWRTVEPGHLIQRVVRFA
jgi:secreted PhoX family phosphatase